MQLRLLTAEMLLSTAISLTVQQHHLPQGYYLQQHKFTYFMAAMLFIANMTAVATMLLFTNITVLI